MVDTIVFKKCIFKSINSVFYIYELYFSQNTTKKIVFQQTKQTKQTKKKIFTNEISKSFNNKII